ncbi:MAG TPA: hypothetical protein VNQ76_04365 [Planctomicrobium sp.]|nr:hypothetical protein [Planctomicrobium sp.]
MNLLTQNRQQVRRKWVGVVAVLFLLGVTSHLNAQTPPADLSANKQQLFRDYERFEKSLFDVAEQVRQKDPERAELLYRARAQSQEQNILAEMRTISELLRSRGTDGSPVTPQLGSAADRQAETIARLEAVLKVLQSLDERERLASEIARVQDLLKDTNRIIARQKDVRAETQRGRNADRTRDAQKKVAEETQKLADKIDQQDAQLNNSQNPSQNQNDEKSGEKSDGKKSDDKQSDGKQSDGKKSDSQNGGSKPGEDSADKDSSKENSDGKKSGEKSDSKDSKKEDSGKSDKSESGKSEQGQPQEDGKPSSENQPSDGSPQQGSPQQGEQQGEQGKSGEQGQQSQQQDQQGQNQQGQKQQQTAGREELEQARQKMQQAIEELEAQKKDGALKNQDDAVRKLEELKAQLEEILRQLREGERESYLTLLEARFQNMLKRQQHINQETIRLSKIPVPDRTRQNVPSQIDSLRKEQDGNAIEAEKASRLLKDEGSSVAFPEAVDQMHENMLVVVSRLSRQDVGGTTQVVEQLIVETLDEMIAALRKELEKKQDPQQQSPQGGQQGGPQEPSLVDQIAELKLIRSLQNQVYRLTKQIGTELDGQLPENPDQSKLIQELRTRQERIQKATYDLSVGRNE